ncbi:hypothetical protein GW17_00004914 [Ensete ventricosum]|nr:hypothetical protein GW17_00004914 [Ensete ventricosum]
MISCCRSIGKRLKSALLWVLTSAVVCGLVLGILYGKNFLPNLFAVFCYFLVLRGENLWRLRGEENDVRLAGFLGRRNISPRGEKCDAYGAPVSSETTWTMQTTFPEYVVALATIVGSVLFTVLGLIILFFDKCSVLLSLQAETLWALTVLGYLGKLVLGIIG